MFDLLRFGYHPTRNAVPRVSGGIGFHVVGLGVDDQRGSSIAENGVAVISEIHISVDDARLHFTVRVHGDVLHVAGMMAFRILESVLFVVGVEVRAGGFEIGWVGL
jgi:hypothetical protein